MNERKLKIETISVGARVVYQAVNFHHYVVDAFIWRVRKKPIRVTLGVS